MITAMVFALFVAAPAADAFTCIGETTHQTAASPGDEPGHHSGRESDGGVCSHGHFHASFARLDQVAAELATFSLGLSYAVISDDGAVPFAVDSPERPPRV